MADIELLRTQARSYKRKAEIMADAAAVASGQGNMKLSNDCWALNAHLKRRQTEVNDQICKLWNPAYPSKHNPPEMVNIPFYADNEIDWDGKL